MTDEWSDWIEHDGTCIPQIVIGKLCQAKAAGGYVCERVITGRIRSDGMCAWIWSTLPASRSNMRCVAYRIRRPKALIALIEMAANLPERVDA